MSQVVHDAYKQALLDENAQAMRELTCRTITIGLEQTGSVFWGFGFFADLSERQALAVAAQMGAELARSAMLLFAAEASYAGSALVRQLVEIEYLMYLFSNDVKEASQWWESNARERRSLYQPAQMRRRSSNRFRDQEYRAHCEQGGHPNPRASNLLPDHMPVFGTTRWMWVDLGQHLERLWGFFVSAAELQGLSHLICLRHEVSTAIADWHATDPCASRLSDQTVKALVLGISGERA